MGNVRFSDMQTTTATEKNVILILADISGYTQFMLANQQSVTHAQMIITGLLQTIISQVEIPLEVSKIEGDAVFLYAVKEKDERSWDEIKHKISDKLISFFKTFSAKLEELSASLMCQCGACENIHKLKLKIVAHSGRALFYMLGNFCELSGVDVIAVHRLLKNSVAPNQYILLTDAAFRDLEFKGNVDWMEETYDVGTLKTCVHFPEVT